MVKQAYGALYLNGDDSAFTGALDIQGGWVRLNATGLGASANPVTVRSGAYLDLYGGFLEKRPVTICGFGYNYSGALRNNHATLDSAVSGPVTLAGVAGIFVSSAARKLTLDG